MLNNNKRQIIAKRTIKRMLKDLIAIWTTEQILQFETGDNTLGWWNQQ